MTQSTLLNHRGNLASFEVGKCVRSAAGKLAGLGVGGVATVTGVDVGGWYPGWLYGGKFRGNGVPLTRHSTRDSVTSH